MKIVFLDAHTTNPGDLSFDRISLLGNFSAYAYSTNVESIERGQGADVVIVNKHVVGKELLASWPRCKLIVVAATGYNNIDLKACDANDVLVSNVKAYSTDSVAQLTFASILNVVNNISYYNKEVVSGRWAGSRDFSFYDHSIRDLSALTLGIYGTGDIGLAIAKIGQAFGMNIIAMSKYPSLLPSYVKSVDQNTLFAKSNVLSFNVPLNNETLRLVNKSSLGLMKSDAILVNTSRGPLIDENDLSHHLKSHPNFHAILDVLTNEPPLETNPLIGLPNCHITPHIAWASLDARKRLIEGIAINIDQFKKGSPVNLVK